jgi:dihydroorotase
LKESWTVAHELQLGAESLVPFRAGQTIPWKLQD